MRCYTNLLCMLSYNLLVWPGGFSLINGFDSKDLTLIEIKSPCCKMLACLV